MWLFHSFGSSYKKIQVGEYIFGPIHIIEHFGLQILISNCIFKMSNIVLNFT